MIKSNLEPIEESDLVGVKKESVEIFGQNDVQVENKIEVENPQEIAGAEKDDSYGKILSKVQSDDVAVDQFAVAIDAQLGSQKIDAESQVQHLVDLAMQKGVVHAVNVAKHMENNYVLDSLHDRMLATDLHDALLAKGMIKEL
ncbi:MAG: hypothetical protein WCI36_02070 [bacterium]